MVLVGVLGLTRVMLNAKMLKPSTENCRVTGLRGGKKSFFPD